MIPKKFVQGGLILFWLGGITGCTAPHWSGGGYQPEPPPQMNDAQGLGLIAQEPPSAPTDSRRKGQRYSNRALDYFEEIAFGSEFTQNRQTLRVRKWVQDLRIAVRGRPTRQDRGTLNRIVGELNALVAEDDIRLVFTNTNPNVEIYFVPHGQFPRYEPNYVPGNLGFFYGWWNGRMELVRSRILISSDRITQPERNHLIREELTQALGLMNDAWTYEDSTFYQGWTRTQDFSSLDRELVRILYDPRVKPGQNPDQVRRLLR